VTEELAIDVATSAPLAFALFQDYSRRLLWDPFLCEALLLDATSPEVGVKARCVARPRWLGLSMDTVYVSYRPPDLAAVKMVSGPILIATFAASLRHRPLSSESSRVIYRYHFATRPRWLSPLLERLLKIWFRWETRRRLEAFRDYVALQSRCQED